MFLDRHCSFIFPLCLIEGSPCFDSLLVQFLCKVEVSLSTMGHTPCHKLQRQRSSHRVTNKLIHCENSTLCLLCFCSFSVNFYKKSLVIHKFCSSESKKCNSTLPLQKNLDFCRLLAKILQCLPLIYCCSSGT